jgi:hypothetical protein
LFLEPSQPHGGRRTQPDFGGGGAIIQKHARALGFGSIVSKRLGFVLPRRPIARLAEYKNSLTSAAKRQGRGGVAVSDDYKIYVDASQPATLNDGASSLTDCPTLQEAVLAWHKLPPGRKIRATVKVIGGPVYAAYEIDRLSYGPKPA